MTVGPRRAQIALVLAGGAARGAYEVGVIQHLLDQVPRTLGREIPIDIVCGTSVGAINACHLAAHAHEPHTRASLLVRAWESLRIAHVIRPDTGEMFGMIRGLFGMGARAAAQRKGALLDPTGLQRIVATVIPFHKIADNLRAGKVTAVAVSTTHIHSGRTVVWVQRQGGGLPRWGSDPTILPRATTLGPVHALASAAIPLFFPAVELDGEWHCDGGLRQNVPLSPARRLGADGLVVISPKYADARVAPATPANGLEEQPTPLELLGKTLNALMLDRLDADLDRLQRMTSMLDAGTAMLGPGFVDQVNRQMGNDPSHQLRPLRTVLIRASQDLGKLAGEFVRSPAFTSRASGMVARVLRRLAGAEPEQESDLLSYLLFDGAFARQLMELGRADARAKHDELCAFFERMHGAVSEDKAETG
jgi:NTE family protein